MTLIALMVSVFVLVILGIVAYWIITKFFPEPMKVVALAVVGMILLIILLVAVFPDVGGYQVWRR